MLGVCHLKSTHTVAVKLDSQLEGDVGKESRVVIYSFGSQLDRLQTVLLPSCANPIQHPERDDWPGSKLQSASTGTAASMSTLGREEEWQCRQATRSGL